MIKIIDFGLAAPIYGRDGSGYLKTALGTFGYMSPELHLGREYSGEKVDVFALGVILFVKRCRSQFAGDGHQPGGAGCCPARRRAVVVWCVEGSCCVPNSSNNI